MKQTWYKVVLFSLLGVISFCMVAIAFRIFSANELPASFIGACLGAIISAIITQTLLSAQTQSEEAKERNVKIWETNKFKEVMNWLCGTTNMAYSRQYHRLPFY